MIGTMVVHRNCKHNLFWIISIFFLLNMACVEEIAFETENFESALVINAVITNEEIHQEILLSRTYRFEEDGPTPVSNAVVKVVGNNEEFLFEESETGKYVSNVAFSALPNIDYKLQITTGNGKMYSSNQEQLTSITIIDALYAQREINDDGVDGVSMYLDSFDPTGNSKYYRYDYEETFKIIAPEWVSEDLMVVPDSPNCEVIFVPRPKEQRTCYRTEFSKGINQTNTTNLAEDRVSRHLARFVSSQNYIISHRYSILVKQYIQTEEAYNYLKTINNFSSEGSIFSQLQPGYVLGNIISEGNPLEKVVGFFEVSSVSSKRIFFNYTDFYPNELLPPYIISCQFRAPKQFKDDGSCGGLITGILNKSLVYLEPNIGQIPMAGPYLMVDRPCGDCTVLGSSTPPDFWIE